MSFGGSKMEENELFSAFFMENAMNSLSEFINIH